MVKESILIQAREINNPVFLSLQTIHFGKFRNANQKVIITSNCKYHETKQNTGGERARL